MTQNKNQKRLVRQLAEIRGCSYCQALDELRKVPAGKPWVEYVADQLEAKEEASAEP